MKKIALAALIVVAGTAAAMAGSYVDPVIEPEVIVAQTSSSSGIVIPLLLLLLVAVAVL
jgi:opacity protein-like surface antigen